MNGFYTLYKSLFCLALTTALMLPGTPAPAQEQETSPAAQARAPAQPSTAPAAAGGQTAYVDDKVYVNLRAAPDSQGETLKVIPSGTRMTILERGEQSGYSRVRLDSGEEGWLLQRYLSDTPIAADRLDGVQQRLDRAEADKARLQNELNELRSGRKDLSTQAAGLEQENQALKTELARLKEVSAEPLKLAAESRRAAEQLETESARRREAEQAAETARNKLSMFAAGAGLIGLGIGFYVGYTPVRREKQWRRMPKL